jgi:hypothetical protein
MTDVYEIAVRPTTNQADDISGWRHNKAKRKLNSVICIK